TRSCLVTLASAFCAISRLDSHGDLGALVETPCPPVLVRLRVVGGAAELPGRLRPAAARQLQERGVDPGGARQLGRDADVLCEQTEREARRVRAREHVLLD